MHLTLWDHQRTAVDAAVGHLASGGRATVLAACGTGKTAIGAAASLALAPNGTVLIVVPTITLVMQTVAEYQRLLGGQAGQLVAVCSDSSGARTTRTADAAAIRSELDRRHVAQTTDPERIAALATPGRVTMVATYASLGILTRAHAGHGLPAWDLAIIDEAHRSTGFENGAWTAIHRDEAIPARRRLNLTATARMVRRPGPGSFSMNDRSVFGPVVHELGFGEAIDRGLLADYEVVIATTTDADAARITAANEIVSTAGTVRLPARMLAAQIALARVISSYDLQRVLTCHNRVTHARRFAGTLAATTALLPADERPRRRLSCHLLTGGMELDRRETVLDHLAHPGDDVSVVANVRVLSEGVDVPELDAVVFADPRTSPVDIIQATGRALRRGATDTKTARIIIPVVLPDGIEPAKALDDSAFDIVWSVVRGLRHHDERLATWIDEQRRGVGGGASEAVPGWLTGVGSRLDPEAMRAIGIAVIDRASPYSPMLGSALTDWDDAFERARRFHGQHGHLDIPQDMTDPDGFALGTWLSWQRTRHAKGLLPADRVDRLETLGMTWNQRSAAWDRGLAAARDFGAEHGHLAVPSDHRTAEGLRLGQWIRNQKNRIDRLSEHQRAQLAAIDPHWELDLLWRRQYARATEYHAAHGHLDMPRTHKSTDGAHLGEWLHAQRRDREQLSAKQRELLDSIGIRWSRPSARTAAWDRGLAAARAFHAEHGHLAVKQSYINQHGFRLGTWISNVRRRRGRLAPERVAQLDELGIEWPNDDEGNVPA